MASTKTNPVAPEPSSLTKLISSAGASESPLAATTTQILHNLQYQHLWTSLETHNITSSPEPTSSKPTSSSSSQLNHPITLISGIPPHRLYAHPDEQLYMLEKGLRDDDLCPERMFVLPTAQGQSWTLRRMAAVFAALPDTSTIVEEKSSGIDPEKVGRLTEYYEKQANARATREWGGKRLLLAMVDKGMGGDGTVVYYVVQEGEVKPRQN